jgi:hypothetical protein
METCHTDGVDVARPRSYTRKTRGGSRLSLSGMRADTVRRRTMRQVIRVGLVPFLFTFTLMAVCCPDQVWGSWPWARIVKPPVLAIPPVPPVAALPPSPPVPLLPPVPQVPPIHPLPPAPQRP